MVTGVNPSTDQSGRAIMAANFADSPVWLPLHGDRKPSKFSSLFCLPMTFILPIPYVGTGQ